MAKTGQRVVVHYIGSLDDGTVFDNSIKRNQPIQFVLGAGNMIEGFEKAIYDMEVGETKTVKIPAAEGYGEYSEDAIQAIPADRIANADQLPVGGRISFTDPNGNPCAVKVLKIEDGMVWFDFNHELAGKDLTFEITLVEARGLHDDE